MRNSDIGELLARAAEHAKQPLQRALRRASRRALLWPEEAEEIINDGRSLTELPGIGPYLNRQIVQWWRIRRTLTKKLLRFDKTFLTLAEARAMRSRVPGAP